MVEPAEEFTIDEEEGNEGYKVVPVSNALRQTEFAVVNKEGAEALSLELDDRGSITASAAVSEGEERIISLARQYFSDMGETPSVDAEHMKTLIHSSSPGVLFTLEKRRNNEVTMVVAIDDYRLKAMPSPIRFLIPTIAEIKGIPEKGVGEAFDKIQEARRVLPGHI